MSNIILILQIIGEIAVVISQILKILDQIQHFR